MDDLAQSAAKELAERWTVDNVAASAVMQSNKKGENSGAHCLYKKLKEWDHQTLDIMKRMKDMATTTVKVNQTDSEEPMRAPFSHSQQAQVDANEVQAIIQAILDKEQDLLNTFAEIDRLEQVINTIKTTYNQVAQSVDAMEKAISASVSTTSFPFRLVQYLYVSLYLALLITVLGTQCGIQLPTIFSSTYACGYISHIRPFSISYEYMTSNITI